ncbi:DUF4375 domain-containing protein [Cognatishimia sp. 1_MG-2023]|uniref:DMP19 family protein n=1 Tax=Cognatishimia sp. 1_MG-2023 TaxID=3062642 RepID=UPI0026E3C6B7|nr:DUF4375 domain-containing protein [Cognatishimia sp. 1_MG-2023]MDO6725691.1 DUF4375 domain-containing protein [Cognatishimia sp. 1_MG-2023]
MDVYEFAETLNLGEDISSLPEFERTIFVIVALETEVNNGGFDQFYFNSSGRIANEVPNALVRIGAPIMANIVQRSNAILGLAVPLDDVARQTKLEKLEEDSEGIFEVFDDEFLAYPEDLNQLLQRYYAQRN